MTRWTFEQRLLAAAVLAWAAVAVVNLATDPLLGYDEAAFAALARFGVALGGDAWLVRLPFALLCLGLPLAAYALGRAAFGPRTGGWAAAVLATGHQMLGRNAHVLGDLPAAIGVVAGLAIVVGELSREAGPRRRLLLAAPAFAFAFYMRYGSAPVIALAVGLAPLVWFRGVRRAPGLVLATGALLALLLVPHALHALDETGSALGVLRFSAGVPRRAYVGEGLVTYVTANPFLYYGVLVAPCVVAGLAGLALRRRAPAYLALVALGQILAIGLQSHAQPRYVFVAVAILAVVGVGTLGALVPRASWRLALGALAVAWLAGGWLVVRGNRHDTAHHAAFRAAGEAVRRDTGGRPCIVLATSLPQVLWYAGCGAGRWYYDVDAAALSPARARYVVEVPGGYGFDPQWATDHGVTLHAVPTGDARAHVWRVERSR